METLERGLNKVAMVYKMSVSQELKVQHPGLYLKEGERKQVHSGLVGVASVRERPLIHSGPQVQGDYSIPVPVDHCQL